MVNNRKFRTALALVLVTVTIAPAFAQNRFMEEAKEKAARREENKAIREAEHPEGVASNAAPATPATPAAPAAAAPTAPAAPAAPAQAPAAPAPAQ
jgi:hypothetical protein